VVLLILNRNKKKTLKNSNRLFVLKDSRSLSLSLFYTKPLVVLFTTIETRKEKEGQSDLFQRAIFRVENLCF
jgi:hypothetical protein